ncbi:hypothetical protein NDU88_002390 [Pleurodeles waltl]|uniref:Uncharacterized protein n=1 Tax=Pleurodeles waltl TaxID=8319 RepID=A0AAV7T1S9_PLEWA|nr:hypothetical protein NDU88_002390 [Pleurodeles waltl]
MRRPQATGTHELRSVLDVRKRFWWADAVHQEWPAGQEVLSDLVSKVGSTGLRAALTRSDSPLDLLRVGPPSQAGRVGSLAAKTPPELLLLVEDDNVAACLLQGS